MKKILLLFLVMLPLGLMAQINRYYCEVKGTQKALSSGLNIIFDFGDKPSYTAWGTISSKLKFVDENGDEIEFNSMVDAANYMVEKGWNFQQAYSTVYNGALIIHWIFYKEAESFEKAREGIMTKDDYKRKKNLQGNFRDN